MIKFVLLLLLPTIILSRECIFHTDTVHTVNPPRFQGESGTGTKQYECLEGDNYCVYFEGIFETTGRNQTFDVRSCESDLMYYIGPIGETIGHELEVRCQGEGEVTKRIGAFSYYINCCTKPNCNNMRNASFSNFNSAWASLTLSFASVFGAAYIFF